MNLSYLPIPFITIAGLLLTPGMVSGEALPAEPGAMLRQGTWTGGVGTYSFGAPFADLPSTKWPTNGWSVLRIETDHIEVKSLVAPKGKLPEILRPITVQIDESIKHPELIDQGNEATPDEWKDEIYLRVTGVRLREGSVPVYLFKNGTANLLPQLDNRYALKLGSKEFAFTVHNGFRTKAGATYGEGAQYVIEYDGQAYRYNLGQFGWASRIIAIADLDGDGKPDFIIHVDGSNSGYEAVLLSSKAKPGDNVPTASLSSTGC